MKKLLILALIAFAVAKSGTFFEGFVSEAHANVLSVGGTAGFQSAK